MSSPTDVPRSVWVRFWFTPSAPTALAFVRSVVFLTLAGLFLHELYTGLYDVFGDRPENLWEPISILAPIPLPVPSTTVFVVLAVVGVAASLATITGILPRTTGLVAAGAGLYIMFARNSFGKIDHNLNVLAFMLIITVFAPAIPLWWRRSDHAGSGNFTWPVTLIRMSFALMLASAAWTKLRVSGIDWALSENLRNVLISENLFFRDPQMSELAVWIAAEPWRWQLAAVGALAAEGLMITYFFLRPFALRLIAFSLGAGLVIGLNYLLSLGGWVVMALLPVFIDAGYLARTTRERDWERWALPATVIAVAALAVAVFMSRRVALTIPALAVLAMIPALLVVVRRHRGLRTEDARAATEAEFVSSG